MISVVCVYNDPEVLRDYLLKGLADQSVAYELIVIDNTQKRFSSAAAGLNYGATRANGEYVAFTHQDVRLLSRDWLKDAERLMRRRPDLGVAGVAGMRKPNNVWLSAIGTVPFDCRIYYVYQGETQHRIPCPDTGAEPCEVQTLDEQILIVPREVIRLLPFDERACSGWDLYGVDYSLSVKCLQRKAYVIPLPVWHFSAGRVTPRYFRALRNVLAKHQRERIIATTCGVWHTSVLLNCLGWSLMGIKSELGLWFGRNHVGGRPFLENIKALLLSRF